MEEEIGGGGVPELDARRFREQEKKLLANCPESMPRHATVVPRRFAAPGLLFGRGQARHLGDETAEQRLLNPNFALGTSRAARFDSDEIRLTSPSNRKLNIRSLHALHGFIPPPDSVLLPIP
jgi:hypothetical protein